MKVSRFVEMEGVRILELTNEYLISVDGRSRKVWKLGTPQDNAKRLITEVANLLEEVKNN